MGDVVRLKTITNLDIPAEQILESALEAELTGVVVVGWKADGEMYFASGIAAASEIVLLLELAKKTLLETWDSDE